MKKSIIIIATIVLTFSFTTISAQNTCCSQKNTDHSTCNKAKGSKTNFNTTKGEKETSFNVSGNCEMCETRIENAAKSVDGVQTAEWDKTSKMLKITYNSDVNAKDVQKVIVEVGHDTENYKAEDVVYNALPGCCKYER